ncbi:MAG TPA: GMC family oxidoreductase [Candidatus Acidoferrum sp.]|nr:GMC family oxidoreductase [Candidatus Acidoferrum sp.]
MPQKLKEVDVVVIGVGFAGAILAKELAASGLKVVGLERGRERHSVPDFQAPAIHDELKYSIRKGMMQDVTREAMTFRNHHKEIALPIRQWEAFLPGTGLGGSGVHWNGQTWRFQTADFNYKTHIEQRYGKNILDPDVRIQDWGVSYQELEPHYDRFEYLLGVCGKAGNLNGKIQAGGNPLEAPRSREYPNPPMKEQYSGALFRKAALELGYHPFIQPSANMTRAYTNPEGVTLNPCVYCGFCERYGCEHFAKSSPQTVILPVLMQNSNFELRTEAQVLRINVDSSGKKATGVSYMDSQGRQFEQPASLVLLTAFALNDVRMLLLSGIGQPYDPVTEKGVVGRNYAYQTLSSVWAFLNEDVHLNSYMGAGSSGTLIDDFSVDNFDHSSLGFIGGCFVAGGTTHARPIEFHPTPPGTPRWGSQWKQAVRRHYNHAAFILLSGTSAASRWNYLDLDPTYRDAWGLPLLRMTFEFPDNDVRMSRYITSKAGEIARRMGGKPVEELPRTQPFTTTAYQSTHNTGGAVMGTDPATSVVNRYCQSWDVPNVFVVGACNYPQNSSYNPTGTLGALIYWTADAIKTKYLKNPGHLV